MSEKRQCREVAVAARRSRGESFALEITDLLDLRAGVNGESEPGKYRAEMAISAPFAAAPTAAAPPT